MAREQFGVLFQRGFGRFADTTFRIGHLGAVDVSDMVRGLSALEGTLAQLGAPCPSGAWQSALGGKDGDAGSSN